MWQVGEIRIARAGGGTTIRELTPLGEYSKVNAKPTTQAGHAESRDEKLKRPGERNFKGDQQEGANGGQIGERAGEGDGRARLPGKWV